MDLEALLAVAKTAALQASAEVLKIYQAGDFAIERKADHSPLTRADRAAHASIVHELGKTHLPLLSEEGRTVAYEERKHWTYFWMIDPIDGTKEFIQKNGEFTVNIALIHQSRAVLGVVLAPVSGKLYSAAATKGAYLEQGRTTTALKVSSFRLSQPRLHVVASRSHLNHDTETFLSRLNQPDVIKMGSSLKLLAVAEGSADLYPRFSPTMEWDTAAAQIVIEEAGGKVLQHGQHTALQYNKASLLNPRFLASGKLII